MMAREDLELVPIVDDEGALAGVMTERALARRYIRESREASELDAPTRGRARSSRCWRASCVAARTARSPGRVWVHGDGRRLAADARSGRATWSSSATATTRSGRRSSSASACWSRATARGRPTRPRARAGARHAGRLLAAGQLRDSRMVTLSAPCRALMDSEPLTARPDDLLSDIPTRSRTSTTAPRSRSTRSRPVGLVTRTRLVNPQPAPRAARRPRRAGAERPRRRAGRDRRDPRPPPHRLDRDDRAGAGDVRPRRLDRDARGRALPPERDGAEPLDGDRCCSARSCRDTVILNSPTTTERDHAAVEYLERVLALDATEFGREMFEATSDVSGVGPRRSSRATPRSTRSAAGRRS